MNHGIQLEAMDFSALVSLRKLNKNKDLHATRPIEPELGAARSILAPRYFTEEISIRASSPRSIARTGDWDPHVEMWISLAVAPLT